MAFVATGSTALTITMGSKAPSMAGSQTFAHCRDKRVTVKVPADATGYTSSWGSSFRLPDVSRTSVTVVEIETD
jgi:hypothetical protein